MLRINIGVISPLMEKLPCDNISLCLVYEQILLYYIDIFTNFRFFYMEVSALLTKNRRAKKLFISKLTNNNIEKIQQFREMFNLKANFKMN